MFSAIFITKDEAGQQKTELVQFDDAQLPVGDVTVDVEYSTLNFKDAAAITGARPVVRQFPMVPGVDFAGVVRESRHPDYKIGEKVVLNCWLVGEAHYGGLAQRARVNGDWLIPLPPQFSTRQAMAIGSAGYTAALCVDALMRYGVTPQHEGEVLVTGATGGVGSVAVALLAKAGFRVAAATGKASEGAYLKELGATTTVDRADLSVPGGKPLQKQRWAGAIDTVGSHTLVNVCAQTRYGGAVIATGNAQGMDFHGTVAPFILRAVALLGVECVTTPKPLRMAAWARLGRDLNAAQIESIAQEISLAEAIPAARDLLAGKVRGRIVVDVNR
jgi:acrylyl-CoA reductase (NADPH)